MPRFAALLRGVNVGGANLVPMAALRALLEDLGHARVATLLNSGNAVFTASDASARRHEQSIRAALRDALGVDVPVLVRTVAALEAAAAENPFPVTGDQGSRLLVGFATTPAALAALADLPALARAPERCHVGRHAIHLWCPDGAAKSPVAKLLLGRRGRDVTTRNWATLGKLIALAHGG